ncbi:MAG: chorismate-binding protein, partial [Campylobacter sp.]|nr:chorismate-binding protein [Campylobacter sp.]
IKVVNPMHIKLYESVMHIVSDIYAELSPSTTPLEALTTIFPAGTLSGSPKIRAMQIINELESCSRGIYGGGIGFWHFNGDMQMAILIRSAIFTKNLNSTSNRVFIGAGAGIVWDSVAQNEYDEICNKRKSCLKIFEKYATQRD